MLIKCVCGTYPKSRTDHCQITDLLQLSRKERESRLFCIDAMRRRSEWKKMHGSHASYKMMVCAKLEGILLKRQVLDSISFYRMVKRQRVLVFKHYIEKLQPRNTQYGAV